MSEYRNAAQNARPYRRPVCPDKRTSGGSKATLQTYVITRDGEAPFCVQTSTPRILEPATPAMRNMLSALFETPTRRAA